MKATHKLQRIPGEVLRQVVVQVDAQQQQGNGVGVRDVYGLTTKGYGNMSEMLSLGINYKAVLS